MEICGIEWTNTTITKHVADTPTVIETLTHLARIVGIFTDGVWWNYFTRSMWFGLCLAICHSLLISFVLVNEWRLLG